MSHMVMFRSAEGKPGYHQTESLDEAIGFVEHLRNQEQVPEARIFRMEEVRIEVRTYYKVEVAKAPAPSASPAPTTTAPLSPPSVARDKVVASAGGQADDPVVIEPMTPGNGTVGAGSARFGRFNRS